MSDESAQTALRLPREDLEALRRLARIEDRPVAYLIRRGIQVVLSQGEARQQAQNDGTPDV